MQVPRFLAALAAIVPVSFAQSPIGFDAIANDPTTAGLFGNSVSVVGGEPVRAIAQNLEGNTDGVPFINVTRWIDARPFRGQVLSVSKRVHLRTPAPDTQASLWVKVVRANGAVGFHDHGRDIATSSSEWTRLRSVGAIANDATDIFFGLLVEGTTPVHIEDFELELMGKAGVYDARLSVPNRWLRDPSVELSRVSDRNHGLHLRVTSFAPSGYQPGELPTVWFLRDTDDLTRTFDQGRALLDAMRRGTEPACVMAFVEPIEAPTEGRPLIELAPELFLSHLAPNVTGAFAPNASHALVDTRGQTLEFVGGERSTTSPDPKLAAILAAREPFQHERLQLRWAESMQVARNLDDPSMAALLFDTARETMSSWTEVPLVRRASHSLAGHSCAHDHSHGDSHSHSHGEPHTHSHNGVTHSHD